MLKALFRADFLHLASLFMSTEETRYYLNGVYVEPAAGGGVVLVAADGHRLCVFHDAEGFIDAPSIVVPPKGLAGVMQAKCRRSAAYLGFIGEGSGCRRYGRVCTLLRDEFPKKQQWHDRRGIGAKPYRRSVGVEIEPKYFDMACRRIEAAGRHADLFVTA